MARTSLRAVRLLVEPIRLRSVLQRKPKRTRLAGHELLDCAELRHLLRQRNGGSQRTPHIEEDPTIDLTGVLAPRPESVACVGAAHKTSIGFKAQSQVGLQHRPNGSIANIITQVQLVRPSTLFPTVLIVLPFALPSNLPPVGYPAALRPFRRAPRDGRS